MYIKYKELYLKLENSGIKTTLVDLYIFKCSKLLWNLSLKLVMKLLLNATGLDYSTKAYLEHLKNIYDKAFCKNS